MQTINDVFNVYVSQIIVTVKNRTT